VKAAVSLISKTVEARLRTLPSIAVAVSGGGDSMALLLLMKHQLAPSQLLAALTVDHALRKTSAAEAGQVKSWCKALGIPHSTLKWQHGEITTGIQAKARAARYQLMADYCAKHKINALLTAHTKDDQAETVAMRMARTSSSKSLSAVWPETEIGGLVILRPLLSAKREQLRDYLVSNDQSWLEDPSNSDSRFERARLRGAGVALSLAGTAAKAQRKVKSAQLAAQKWLAQNLHRDVSSMVEFEAKAFNKLSITIQDDVLIRIIEMLGGKVPELAKRQGLLNWIEAPTSTRRSLGGVIFALRKNSVRVGREPSRILANTIELSPTKSLLWDNRFLVIGPKGSTITFKAKVKALKRIKNLRAFVDQGLPVIVAGDEVLATPQFSHHRQAKLTLIVK
jgi:tRNA(Ile)-lysidine synthase